MRNLLQTFGCEKVFDVPIKFEEKVLDNFYHYNAHILHVVFMKKWKKKYFTIMRVTSTRA